MRLAPLESKKLGVQDSLPHTGLLVRLASLRKQKGFCETPVAMHSTRLPTGSSGDTNPNSSWLNALAKVSVMG